MSAAASVPSLVQDFLEQSAARLPGKVALEFAGRGWTYGELEVMANRLANALIAQGIRRGDRVALHLGNGVEVIAGIFAVLKAGGVFVVLSSLVKETKLKTLLNNFRATALVARAGPENQALLASVVEAVPSLKFLVVVGQESHAASAPRIPVLHFDAIQQESPAGRPPRVNIDLDLACLIYTSGTTGEAKGVMCGHSNMVFVTTSIVEYLENCEDDVILSVLPVAFSYGLYQLLATFRTGGKLVLEESFAYPAVILQRLEKVRATGMAGTPTIYALLLQIDCQAFDLSHLRYLTNAAAGLPVEHVRRIRERFPAVRFYSMHGLTEVARTVYLPPHLVDQKPGSVGLAIPGTEAWLVDEKGNRLGPGATGELVIRGRHVMRGYWERPEATEERFRPGPIPGERVCYTGDLFRADEDGHFYFVSRKDDIIKCRGEKVAPREVEAVLHTIPGIVEAAVVGVPDPVLGQAVKAVLVTNGAPVKRADVLKACRAQLEDHMVPKHVEFRSELPRTDSGKLRRSALV